MEVASQATKVHNTHDQILLGCDSTILRGPCMVHMCRELPMHSGPTQGPRSLQPHLLCGDAFFHLRCPWPMCTLGLLWTKEILFISLLSFPSAIPLTGPQGLHSISSPLIPFLILRPSALQHPENIWSMAVFLSSLLTSSSLLSLPLKKKTNPIFSCSFSRECSSELWLRAQVLQFDKVKSQYCYLPVQQF